MNQRSVDIFVVMALTFFAVVLAFRVPTDNVAGRIWTLPLVFLLPGHALMSALFSQQALGVLERFIFSLGLSLIIVILGGLVLNWIPFGLQADSWAVFLGSITIVASVIALLRRRGQRGPALGWWESGRFFGFTFRDGLALGLAAMIIGGAIIISIIGAERQPYPGFTQLWMLSANGVNSKSEVLLGVKNMELMAMEYRLVVYTDNTVVKEWPVIDLNQNNTWQATLVLPQISQIIPTRVKAMLYQADAPSKVYRYAILWLGTGGKAG